MSLKEPSQYHEFWSMKMLPYSGLGKNLQFISKRLDKDSISKITEKNLQNINFPIWNCCQEMMRKTP